MKKKYSPDNLESIYCKMHLFIFLPTPSQTSVSSLQQPLPTFLCYQKEKIDFIPSFAFNVKMEKIIYMYSKKHIGHKKKKKKSLRGLGLWFRASKRRRTYKTSLFFIFTLFFLDKHTWNVWKKSSIFFKFWKTYFSWSKDDVSSFYIHLYFIF